MIATCARGLKVESLGIAAATRGNTMKEPKIVGASRAREVVKAYLEKPIVGTVGIVTLLKFASFIVKDPTDLSLSPNNCANRMSFRKPNGTFTRIAYVKTMLSTCFSSVARLEVSVGFATP